MSILLFINYLHFFLLNFFSSYLKLSQYRSLNSYFIEYQCFIKCDENAIKISLRSFAVCNLQFCNLEI